MYAAINGTRLAYAERGTSQSTNLLLIHGFPLDRHLWDAQLAGLSGVARVVAPDLRGSGESQVTPGPYSMDQFADDLVALLDHSAYRADDRRGAEHGRLHRVRLLAAPRGARPGAGPCRHAR